MNKLPHTNPPKWPLIFFRWFCQPDCVEDIEGDLRERYQKNSIEKGRRKANRLLIKEVLLLFRPGMIRPLFQLPTLMYFGFFKHNLRITYRSFLRHKHSFLINLIGLTAGLACVLSIGLWLADELAMDHFHVNDARLFQVLENIEIGEGIQTVSGSSAPIAEALEAEMPQVEHAVAVAPPYWPGQDDFMLAVGEKKLRATGQYVGASYFEMFSFKLIVGDAKQVLDQKSNIVISESLAKRLFNDVQAAMGKEITIKQAHTYTVSGIFEDVPPQSTIQFEFVLSFDVMKELSPWVNDWKNGGPRIYVLLKEGVEVEVFNEKITDFISKRVEGSARVPFLVRFSDLYLQGQYENGESVGGRIVYVKLFSIIALFILFIACINFMNLSTAKATRRLKEIGIKKVLGSSRRILMGQYLGEALCISSIASVLALIVVYLFLPVFNDITLKDLSIPFSLSFVGAILGVAFVTGLIAGSYPAIYLSSFSPIRTLKGKLSSSFREVWARKGLVVFQFSLTILFIVGVLIVYQQMVFIQSQHKGFTYDQVIYFNVEGAIKEKKDIFLAELKKLPGVLNASSTTHQFVGQSWASSSVEWEGQLPSEEAAFEIAGVHYDFIETMGVDLISGRAFSTAYGSETEKVILNEAAVEAIGYEEPLGKRITFMGEKEIIGVISNIHFESFHETLKPMIMILLPAAHYIVAKLQVEQEKEALENIKALYTNVNPGFTFTYRFLDEAYQKQHEAEQKVAILSRYFAGLAIIISCLGLLGLVAFSAERRLKEISIRKILGSSHWNIILLLSSDFTKMILVSICLALPISYFLAQRWLNEFAYRIELEWWYFGLAAGLAICIAWLTVGTQLVKVAIANPIEILRDE